MSQELDKVAREIADVESQIAEVLQQLNQAATQEDRQYLRKKKELLRRIEVQLRNKELWLLQHAEPATSQEYLHTILEWLGCEASSFLFWETVVATGAFFTAFAGALWQIITSSRFRNFRGPSRGRTDTAETKHV